MIKIKKNIVGEVGDSEYNVAISILFDNVREEDANKCVELFLDSFQTNKTINVSLGENNSNHFKRTIKRQRLKDSFVILINYENSLSQLHSDLFAMVKKDADNLIKQIEYLFSQL